MTEFGNTLRTTPMTSPVLYGSDWKPIGTLNEEVKFTPAYDDPDWLGTDPDAPWILPSSDRSISAEFTLTDVPVDFAAWMMGWPVVWVRRPRMKRRAARRVAGYTRTGRRR